MSCCACCCFYPKYKRKVDNIYPRSLDSPLIKIEVEKLQYYVRQHPEKLSKIGEYLYQHLKWGLNGTYKNRNYVKNTVEAVDKILIVITPQNLNYYATNFLKIIQRLLEQGNAIGSVNEGLSSAITTSSEYLEYKKLAAGLFRKFCDKEAANQSTTNYNLNYDSFVSQFSSMCYNNNKDERVRAEIRSAGLQCLATMVKRLVPDDGLRAGYLWDNMDKIVPALLYIMHENYLAQNGANYLNDENQQNEEVETENDERELDRYLYGDFFIHSRTNTNLKSSDSIEQVVIHHDQQTTDAATNGGAGGVRVEYTRKSVINELSNGGVGLDKQINQNTSAGAGASGGGGGGAAAAGASGKISNSSSDETGAMIALNENRLSNATEVVDPDHEAKMLLKNLASKADYTTISKIVLPILAFLDNNKPTGWEYGKFVRCVFLILMYNVKQQHAIVIKELIKHLDSHINSSAKLKCHIIRAISTCIRIAAMHSVGTTGQIIEIFTYLLKHLKFSVEKASTFRAQLLSRKSGAGGLSSSSTTSIQQVALSKAAVVAAAAAAAGMASTTSNDSITNKVSNDLVEEQALQRKIIEAMGQFTSNLPDYSKNDVVMFIARQINSQQFNYIDLAYNTNPIGSTPTTTNPNTNTNTTNVNTTQPNSKDQVNSQIRAKYFECLYEICTRYKSTQLFSAFTSMAFLEDMLRLTLVVDWASRRKAHEILHHLLDKNQLLNKIKSLKPNLFSEFSLTSGVVTVRKDFTASSNLLYRGGSPHNSNLSLNKAGVLNQAQNIRSSTTSINNNGNNSKISRNQTYLSQLELNDLKLTNSKEDIQFMRKYGRLFLAHLNENLFITNNRRENFESIYLTVCLFIIGLFNENEFLVDLIRFGFHLQDLALLNYDQQTFTFSSQCNVHKFVCAYFLLLSKSSGIDALYRYCSEICDLRRKKGLFHYIYPEYILLDAAMSTDSGIQSARVSLSELETEFKRELQSSAKEYSLSIQQQQQQQQAQPQQQQQQESHSQNDSAKNSKSTSEQNEADSAQTTESTEMNKKYSSSQKSLHQKSPQELKAAPWLFNKKFIGEILDNAGYSTSIMFLPNSDYSLSVNYLQQQIPTLQTSLRYRSPFSYSYDSLSNIQAESGNIGTNNNGMSGIGGGMGGGGGGVTLDNHYRNHHRGYSNSGAGLGPSSSMNQFGSTPRRSIDVESNIDDDTSYDSTSQASVDQTELGPMDYDYLNQQNLKLFYVDPNSSTQQQCDSNQQTVNSLSQIKQQLYLQQQQYQDFTSFETIKRVLFNGNVPSATGSVVAGSNTGGSNIGAMNAPSTSGISSGSVINNKSSSNQLPTNLHLHQNGIDLDNDQYESDQQAENSLKIITDFKQKPFDELKQNLMKSNQTYLNTEKYQQVFDLISKELTPNTSNTNSSTNTTQQQQHQQHGSSTLPNQSHTVNTNNNNNSNVQKANNDANTSVNLNGSMSDSNSNLTNAVNFINSNSVGSLSNNSNPSTSVGSLYKENYQQKMVPLNDIEFPQLFMY